MRGLAEAGAARATALEEADRQLDRIARLLHDALQGGVSMAEIARATGVSRQTLYELRGKYGDTTDLRLAVLQTLGTGHASAAEISEHLGRPEQEIQLLLEELIGQGFASWEVDDTVDAPEVKCWLTLAGLRQLEGWTFPEDLDGPNPGRGQ
ncbi:MAG: transposase [Solirubrobacteraceae bacterium]